jgi:hypothetical protein
MSAMTAKRFGASTLAHGIGGDLPLIGWAGSPGSAEKLGRRRAERAENSRKPAAWAVPHRCAADDHSMACALHLLARVRKRLASLTPGCCVAVWPRAPSSGGAKQNKGDGPCGLASSGASLLCSPSRR